MALSILKDQALGDGDPDQMLTVLAVLNEENLRIEITSIQTASEVDMLPLPVVEPEVKMNSIEIQVVFAAVVAEEPPMKQRRSPGSAPGKGNAKPVQSPSTASQQVPVVSCANSENNMQGQQISGIKNGLENSATKDESAMIDINPTQTSFSLKGLAGIPSDTPALIVHASLQNSPGEVKSPSAGLENSATKDESAMIDINPAQTSLSFSLKGLAGIPSDTPALIVHASLQNSPGEVKSPSASKETLLL